MVREVQAVHFAVGGGGVMGKGTTNTERGGYLSKRCSCDNNLRQSIDVVACITV